MLKKNNYLLDIYLNRGLEIVKGRGCWLYDKNKKKYLDMMSNYGANILGYNYKKIIYTIKKQATELINLHGSFLNPIRNLLAKELIKKSGINGKVIFLNSGSEAIEAAIKFALISTKKREIIAFKNSYHGKTLGALSLTYGEKYKKGIENFLIRVNFVKYNDISEFKKILNDNIDNIGIVIIEPIQGDGGIYLASKTFLEELYLLCKKNNIILIIDEIQTGFGRTGKLFCYEWYNIQPNIVCLGKGIAGGLPLSAVIVENEIAKNIPKFYHTSTFGGNILACSVSLKILKILNKKFLDSVFKKGEFLKKELNKIKHPLIKEVRGKGLMIGIEVYDKRSEILKLLQENSVLAIPAGENVIRLLPPLIISKKELGFFIKIFKKVLKNV